MGMWNRFTGSFLPSGRASDLRRDRRGRRENFERKLPADLLGVLGVPGVNSSRKATQKQTASLARGCLGRRDLGEAPVPQSITDQPLLRLLLLVHAGCRRSIAGELFQIILQQADFHAATVGVLRLVGFIRSGGSVAHADQVDAINGDLVVKDEIAHHRLGHLLRVLDRDLALAGRESLHFNDVAALALNAASHFIEGILRVLAQYALAGTETNLGLVGSL